MRLVEFSLKRQADVFREPMAAFCPTYPVDRKMRSALFAWSQPGTRIVETASIPQPLNAFDEKLMGLSVAFGDRDDYRRAIEEAVRRSARLQSWAQGAVAALSDEDRLRRMASRLAKIPPSNAAARLATRPEPYR